MTGRSDGGIERHGVGSLPEHRRLTRPLMLAVVLVGANLSCSATVFGWLPVTYGLDWWSIVAATVIGTALGVAVAAPLALLGFRTGTSSTVASGAFFGVRGRLVGSVIGLLLSLAYTAVTIWTGGEAVLAVLTRAAGLRPTPLLYGAAYAAITVLVAVPAVRGFGLITRVNGLLMAPMGLTLALGVVAFTPGFDTSWSTGTYAMGSYPSTWILALVTAGLSGPIAFATIIGDYTRYVSPRRHTGRRVLVSTGAGLFAGLVIPALFGAFVAISARSGGGSYLMDLTLAAPAWYLPFILISGVVGSLGAAGVPLYNMGLELHAIMPAVSRTAGTVIVSGVTAALVFLGRFAWDMQSAVTAFVVVLTVTAVPWAVIALIGHLLCRGVYDVRDLQVYNKGSSGGRYWFSRGWNPRALAALAAGSTVGLLGADSTLYTGPLTALSGDLDVSFLTSGLIAGGTYLILYALRPAKPPIPIPVWRQEYLRPIFGTASRTQASAGAGLPADTAVRA